MSGGTSRAVKLGEWEKSTIGRLLLDDTGMYIIFIFVPRLFTSPSV